MQSGKGLLLFSFAVLAAAWYGGLGPALLAAGFDIHLTKPVDPEVLQRLFAKMRPSGATDDDRGRRPEREAG